MRDDDQSTHARGRGRRALSSAVSETIIDVDAPAGKTRLFVTMAIKIEVDGDGISLEDIHPEATSLLKRLSKRGVRS